MSPEAFAAMLIACNGRKSITLFMPGIDPEQGLDIDPDTTMLAKDHPDFEQLADVPDSDSLWVATEGPTSLGIGPIKVQIGRTTTLFDIRTISAIDLD
jgi:hypothetical protein